ncbi:MAG: glycosyltransferase [Thermodesulfovibrionales bacterium]|jgi:glycosyltransferase involved in cell wall biosynthesis
MSKYKVAYILTPIEFGGAEKVSLTFLKNVDRDKYTIAPVLLIRPWEKDNFFIQTLEKENYPLYKIPVAVRHRSEGRDYFRVIRCYRMIHSFLRKGSFDLVHTHGYFADIVGIPAAKILGIPHISTCHGFISNDRNLRLYNWLDRIALRFATKIIAVSEGIENDLIRSGIDRSRIVTIQNAVNGEYSDESAMRNRREKRNLLNLSDKDFVAGYVGRLSEEKGIKYLVEAISMLSTYEEIPLKLLIIGEGPKRKDLEDFAKEKNLEQRVFFIGFQSDVENWLPAMDVFVLPSLTEGTPMSLLEAMAYGIPVVASAVGGVPQVIDSGQDGMIVAPGVSREIKDAIYLLYKNIDLRNSVAREAQKKIEANYSVVDWIKKIEAEYHNMRIRKEKSRNWTGQGASKTG